MSTKMAYAQNIKHTLEQIIQRVQDLPAPIILFKPDEHSWSIQEILAHIEEANRYWVEELKRIAKHGPSEWGRTLQHERRLAAVAQANEYKTTELLHKIIQFKDALDQEFGTIEDDVLTLEAPHRNSKFGTKPMAFLIEHFMVEHMNSHLHQIERNITQYQQK